MILLGFAALLSISATTPAKLTVKVAPASAAAKVYIDGKPVAASVWLPAGSHVVKVIRQGVVMERKVLLKPGSEVVLVADFGKKDFRVFNQGNLKYSPLQGKTVITVISDKPGPAVKNPNPQPPALPEGPLRRDNLVPPCPAMPQAAKCLNNPPGAKGALYTYYCLLVNHDFKTAYRLRVRTRDLKWFYQLCKPFCGFYDFAIRDLNILMEKEDQVVADYIVELKDEKGQVVETWKMHTVLVKNGEFWIIKTANGQKIPAGKP